MMSNPLNSLELEQNCNHALKTCNFAGVTGENCAAEFCQGFPATSGTCPQLGLDPQNCCESSDPASCLGAWVQNGGGAAAATPNVCASVLSVLIECSSMDSALIPDGTIYTTGPVATSLASCACYDTDGTYDPDTFDGFASDCVGSGMAAHPTYYKYGSMFDGFCTDIVGPAGAAATTTVGSAPASITVTGDVTATAPGAAQATSNSPASSTNAASSAAASSQQSQITSSPTSPPAGTTSSPAGITSNKVSSPSVSVASSQSASTTTTSASMGVIKASFQKGTLLLLGFSILFSAF